MLDKICLYKVSLRALGFDLRKPDVQRLMTDYDVENTGKINREDFVEIAKDMVLNRDPQEELQRAFKLFSDEASGKISFRNLRKIARELGEKTSDEELRAMINEFDKDGDQEINFEEFVAIIQDD
jgi:centrin-3